MNYNVTNKKYNPKRNCIFTFCVLSSLCFSLLITSCLSFSFGEDDTADVEQEQIKQIELIKSQEETLYNKLSKEKINYSANNIDVSDYQKYIDTYPEGSVGYNEDHYNDVVGYIDFISELQSTYEKAKKYFTETLENLESALKQGDFGKAEELYSEMTEKYNIAFDVYNQISSNFGDSFKTDFTKKYMEKAEAVMYKVRNPWIESELHNDLIDQIDVKYIDLPIYASSEKLGVSLRDVIDKTDFRDYTIYVSESYGYIKIEVRYDFSFSQLDYDFNKGFQIKENSTTLYDFSFTMHVDGNRIVLDTVISQSENVVSSFASDLSKYFRFALIDTDDIEKELEKATSVMNVLNLGI